MSSLPGRSDSQRSYTLGVDEISVRKIRDEEKDGERRKSGVGSMRSEGSSSSVGGEAALHDSCALKQFSRFTSKKQLRFLMWVAYTRKFAGDAITNEERRICPLTWCRTEFEDEQTMLQHVCNCPEMGKGLYFCFHCQKTERLGRFHKGCTGIPSKTDRLTSVAKKIFSKLGAGTHRKTQEKSSTDTSFSVTDCWKSTDEKKANLYDNLPEWDYPTGFQELPDTSICSEMAADWTAACQELADTSIMEMMGTELMMSGLGNEGHHQDNFYAETFEDFNAGSSVPKARMTSPKLPRLDTSMSPLHTGQWQYPTQTSQQVSPSRSPFIPSIDDIVSPMSPIGTFNPNMLLNVSPTDTEASGATFFSDSGYTSATSPGSGSTGSFSRVPSFNDPRGTKRSWDCAVIPEEHNMMNIMAPILFPMSMPNFDQAFTESLNSTPSVSRSTSNASDKSKARDLSPHWEDAPSLVQSFSEVLDEHITHTKTTLRDMPSNTITAELLAMSKSSLVSIGLEVLAGILEGRRPSGAVQVFSFTHVACACAIVMNHDGDAIHKPEWFQDSMSWVSGLSSEKQKQMYTDIAISIWRPENSAQMTSSLKEPLPITSSNKLLKSCQHFLDILENFHNQAQEALTFQPPVSDFDFSQISFEATANKRVIEKLIPINTIVAFISDVVTVGKKLDSGRIKSVRELELELICAGKMSSQSETAYSRFLSHVTHLCDDLYSDQIHTSKSRTSHHINSIFHLKNYLPKEIDTDETHHHSSFSALDFAHDDEDLCFDFAGASGEGETSDFTPAQPFEQNQQLAPPFTHSSVSSSQTQTHTPQHPLFLAPQPPHTPNFHPIPTPSPTPAPKTTTLPIPQNAPPTPISSSSPLTPQNSKKYHCSIPQCNYIPSGEEKWKASNLRRHKRTQHPDLSTGGSKAYPCRWPGCKSVFTRSDNLRSHQRGRGHEGLGLNLGFGGVGGETGGDEGEGGSEISGGMGGSDGGVRIGDGGNGGGGKRRRVD